MLNPVRYTTNGRCKICGSDHGVKRIECCDGMVSMEVCSSCRARLKVHELHLRYQERELHLGDSASIYDMKAPVLEIRKGNGKWKKLITFKGVK